MTNEEIEIVKKHFATWSERDVETRNKNIPEVYAPDLTIIDPHFIAHGRGKLIPLIEDLQNKFPKYSFRLRKPIETHHNAARLFWQLGSEEQPDVNTGMDVFIMEEGLIKTLIVFIDPKE